MYAVLPEGQLVRVHEYSKYRLTEVHMASGSYILHRGCHRVSIGIQVEKESWMYKVALLSVSMANREV